MLPSEPGARHNDTSGQETPFAAVSARRKAAHGLVPDAGRVEVTTSPTLSIATHNEAVGHEMSYKLPGATLIGDDHRRGTPPRTDATAEKPSPRTTNATQ